MIDYDTDAGLRYRLADDEDWTTQTFDAPDRFVAQVDHFLHCIETGQGRLCLGKMVWR